jgi:Flp pilus assembly protein TadD
MRLDRVVPFFVMIVALMGCDLLKINAGIDLQEVFEDGIASFDEPLGLDSVEDEGVDSAADRTNVPAQRVQRQPAAPKSAPSPEQGAIQRALVEAAQSAENNFDYRLATMHYGRLVEMDSEDIASVLGFARNLRYSGKPKEAVLLLKKVLSSSLNHVPLRIQLVKAQIASGLLVEAENNINSLHNESPGEWEVHALQGVILDHAGKFRAAQAAYGEALAISPNNISVLNNMSLSLAQEGKLDTAIRLLEGLVRSEYSNPQVRQNLALFYALRGDLGSAEELARQDLPPNIVLENLTSFRLLQEK